MSDLAQVLVDVIVAIAEDAVRNGGSTGCTCESCGHARHTRVLREALNRQRTLGSKSDE